MSDTWLNIRFGIFHLQCKRESLTKWSFKPNSYWSNWKWLECPFEVCEFEFGGWKKIEYTEDYD